MGGTILEPSPDLIRFVDLRSTVCNAQAAEWMVDLAADLRPEDLAEIEATSPLPPAEALVASLMLSTHAWVILQGEDPICVFGAAPGGVVWMMGSPRMDRRSAALAICRNFARYLGILHATYPVLWNYIDARNTKSLDWMIWGGFQITEAHPHHGPEGRLFYTLQRHHTPCAFPH